MNSTAQGSQWYVPLATSECENCWFYVLHREANSCPQVSWSQKMKKDNNKKNNKNEKNKKNKKGEEEE